MDTLRMWQHLISGDRPVPPSAAELFERGLAFERSGRALDACDAFVDCVAELEAAERPEAAVVNHKLAVYAHEGDRPEDAVFYAVRSVFLYNKCEDLGGLCAALHNLAVIHARRGEPALAETARTQAARARGAARARARRARASGRDGAGSASSSSDPRKSAIPPKRTAGLRGSGRVPAPRGPESSMRPTITSLFLTVCMLVLPGCFWARPTLMSSSGQRLELRELRGVALLRNGRSLSSIFESRPSLCVGGTGAAC